MKFNSGFNYIFPEDRSESGELEEGTKGKVSAKALVPSGVNNMYIVRPNGYVRIITTANTYVKFCESKGETIATTTDILLLANKEYIMFTGNFMFMSLSNTTCNVIKIKGE